MCDSTVSVGVTETGEERCDLMRRWQHTHIAALFLQSLHLELSVPTLLPFHGFICDVAVSATKGILQMSRTVMTKREITLQHVFPEFY